MKIKINKLFINKFNLLKFLKISIKNIKSIFLNKIFMKLILNFKIKMIKILFFTIKLY